MTPIMKELLLNKEAIAINQDYDATPGDVEIACADPGAPPVCSVSLEQQLSRTHGCVAGVTYGCTNGTNQMWVAAAAAASLSATAVRASSAARTCTRRAGAAPTTRRCRRVWPAG